MSTFDEAMRNPVNDNEFITEEQLEKRLSVSKGSLRRRRHRGFNLPCVKLGVSIRYHWPTIREYLLNQGDIRKQEEPSREQDNVNKSKRGRKRRALP